MAILDANVLLRYLTQDHPEHSGRARALIQKIVAGQISVALPEGVLVETVRVLSYPRQYNISREGIRERLTTILRLPQLQLPNKRVYFQALDLYVEYSRLSFVDAICAAQALQSPDRTVISFDRGFRNIPDLNWEQP